MTALVDLSFGPAPPTNEDAARRALAALKDHGVEVYRAGTVQWVGDHWQMDGWDIQGCTRVECGGAPWARCAYCRKMICLRDDPSVDDRITSHVCIDGEEERRAWDMYIAGALHSHYRNDVVNVADTLIAARRVRFGGRK